MNDRLSKYLCGGALLCAAGIALADCAAPRLITPAAQTTADARPILRWTAVDGATGYALKLQSRVPEGRLVASFDVVVTDTQFVPPAALTDERAKVTVSVTARCAGGVSATASAWFLVDVTATCPAPPVVKLQLLQGRGVAAWASAHGVTLYEVRLHGAQDGRVLKMLETREPRAVFDGDWPNGTVLSVRPRCAHGFGEATLGFAHY